MKTKQNTMIIILILIIGILVLKLSNTKPSYKEIGYYSAYFKVVDEETNKPINITISTAGSLQNRFEMDSERCLYRLLWTSRIQSPLSIELKAEGYHKLPLPEKVKERITNTSIAGVPGPQIVKMKRKK